MASTPNILLIEDEPLITLLFVEALEDAGFCVHVAADAKEAMDLVRSGEEISALVTDIRLGKGPNGWEAARAIRQLRPGVPVVYMSADSAHDLRAKGVCGSTALQKPFPPAKLVNVLAALLPSRQTGQREPAATS